LGWRGENSKKTLCQICVNLIGISWRLLTQYATSVSASLIQIMVNKLGTGMAFKRSRVRSPSASLLNTMGCGKYYSPIIFCNVGMISRILFFFSCWASGTIVCSRRGISSFWPVKNINGIIEKLGSRIRTGSV